MLLIQNLSFKIGQKTLFQNISLTILPGAIIYIKGPNGSGKTTFLRLITGILKPTTGQIYLNSINIYDYSKPYCLYIGHKASFKDDLTIYESLKIWSNIYGCYESLNATIFFFKLEEFLNKKFYELSAGNQRKAVLAKTMICNLNLWILDEADIHLDQSHLDLFKNLIMTKANNQGIVVLTSHSNNHIASAEQLNLLDHL